MRILITSGGTKVPIDPVRNITNIGTGRLGSSIAKEALINGHEVIYLTSEDGISPFINKVDYNQPKADTLNQIKELYELGDQFYQDYKEYRYTTFNDYAEKVEFIIKNNKPDIVILTAAVSDFLIGNQHSNKINSEADLQLDFIKAPKIINSIKSFNKNIILIGFKLLIDASEKELVETALKSLKKSQADFIVANNLSSIQDGKHEIYIINPSGSFEKHTNNLNKAIIEKCLQVIKS